MNVSEDVRQFYLGVAGIRMWYAKQPLPGAGPSPEYEFSEAEDARRADDAFNNLEVVERVVEGAEERPKPRQSRPSVDLQALMGASDESKSQRSDSVVSSEPISSEVVPQPPEQVSDSVPAQESTADLNVLSANLGIWVNERYLLVSQWSDEASDRLQDSLARNILRALHDSAVEERKNIQWPVFRNPRVPGQSPDAFQKVFASLTASYGSRKLILLGVFGDQEDAVRSRCLEPAYSELSVDFTESLASLSGSSRLKRELWNQLRPLCKT